MGSGVLNIFTQRQFKSLKTRVVVLSLVIFLTGMWALVYAAGYLLRSDLGNMLGTHQLSTARIVAGDINQELTFRLQALEKVAAGIPADKAGNTAALQNFLGERPLLQNLFNGGYFFVMPDGTATASLPLAALRAGINYRDRDYIARALYTGKSAIGRPVMGRALQSPALPMAVPVRDSEGKIIGALAGITDLAKPNFLNEITDNRYGETGGYLLIDPQNHVIVMASDRKFIMQPPAAAGLTETVEKELGHLEGSRLFIDPQGVEQLLSNICIPSAGWCLAVVIPANDAFAPVYSMQQRLLMIALLLTMASGAAVWWTLRGQLTPLMSAIDEISTQEDSSLPFTPLTVAKDDEVGRLISSFNHLLDSLMKREAALKGERSRAQTYLDTVEAMIVALDVDGTITAINRKGCQILGYCEEELLGQQWFRTCIQQPEGMSLLFPFFKKLVAGAAESFEYFENCVRTKTGELKLIAWHNALLHDEQGQVIGTLSSGDDITERRKVEAEKVNLEGQLRQSQKMEAIGQLAGGIAHDFNNILQVILGYTTLLEFGIPDDQKENLQEIRFATERASELTSGLLSYSRKQVLKLETFELNSLLTGIKKFVQRVLGEDIELCLEHSPIPLVAVIDQVHLQQVFVNLASNARDAMPTGGKLTIRLEQKAGTAGLAGEEQAYLLGPQALITVSDTGTGISADILPNIFEPFFTTKVEGSGTGLGLSIVQGIISQLNGYITCSSEIGAGTTYHLYLPLSGQPAPKEKVSVETVGQADAASTILLVEDDPEVRKINGNLLKMRGYRVLTAENGSEAVAIYARNEQIDLVMLDAVMPGMNGGETLARLREINPEVRTLVVSGYPREIISGRMVLPEDVEFMSKPVRPQLLYDAVKKLLAGEVTGESDITQ